MKTQIVVVGGGAGGPNLYSYAGGNPANLRDPSGLWDLWCTIRGKGCETVTVTATHISWFDLHQIRLANRYHYVQRVGSRLRDKVPDDDGTVPCEGDAGSPTAAQQTRAVNDALVSAGESPTAINGDEGFANLTELPSFVNETWFDSPTYHSNAAAELTLNSELSLKIYYIDYDHGDKNTAAIVYSTKTWAHWTDAIWYYGLGTNSNGVRAQDYMRYIGDCE